MVNYAQTLKASLGRRRRRCGYIESFLLKESSIPSSSSSDPSIVLADRLSSSTPWLVLPPVIDNATNGKIDRFYSPIYNEIFKLNRKKSLKNVPEKARCIWTARGLLVFIDPTDCSLYLSNPFNPTGETYGVTQLPSIETLSSILGVERKSGTDSIESFMVRKPGMKEYDLQVPQNACQYIINHLAVSTDPNTTIGGGGGDLVLMLSQVCDTNPAFCRPGSDSSWSHLVASSVTPLSHRSWSPCIGSKQFFHYKRDIKIVYSQKDKLFYSLWVNDDRTIHIDAWKIQKKPSKKSQNKKPQIDCVG